MSHTFSTAAALAMIATAQPVLAQDDCPTADDLATGIQLIQNDPFVGSTIRYENGLFHEIRLDPTHSTYPVRTMTRPHYLLLPDETGARTLTNEYDIDLTLLDRLPELGTITTRYVTVEPGVATTETGLTLTYGGQSRTNIGPCGYSTWLVEMALDFQGGTYVFDLTYAHELGIMVGLEGPSQNFRYDVIKAE